MVIIHAYAKTKREIKLRLQNKVAFITGGGAGIGRAISLMFAREGADISLAARSTTQMEEVALEIKAMGRRALVNTMDITSVEQVEGAVKETIKEFGRIDILVNNSGIAGPTAPVYEITPEQWDEVFAVNLKGAFLCCRAIVPLMIRQGGGKIINMSSTAAKKPLANRTPYPATKMGLIGFTRGLAVELGKFSINVNAVCPGPVAGPRIERVIDQVAVKEGVSREIIKQRFLSQSPLNSLISAEDVAKLAVFLASEDSKNITGQDLNVDAGALMD
jgi:NAD(P)-dependent dehydrogenase (short-subunit alcohol dehydrogenase family)